MFCLALITLDTAYVDIETPDVKDLLQCQLHAHILHFEIILIKYIFYCLLITYIYNETKPSYS